MHTKNYSIRRMTRNEMDIAIDWAAQEGWNPGLYDADCFYSTDPKGFFIGLVNHQPIACISAVAYGKTFGFIGFYIVKPEFRGQGYGLKIWQRAMTYLNTQNIGLDGVTAQQENYQKSKFKLAYRNLRYQGKSQQYPNSTQIVKLNTVPFKTLIKYDSQLFPTSRPQFLHCWINQPESTALGIVINHQLSGYGVIRRCREGYKIGPLFADNQEFAVTLFESLNNSVPSHLPIFLDIPEVNPAAVALAEHHSMKPVFATARMYTHRQPPLPLDKIFGVTTFELG